MTHRIVWCTDIHLDHLWEAIFVNGLTDGSRRPSEVKVAQFCQKILDKNPDSVLITGDNSIAPMIETHLGWLEKHIPGVPIYFTLGNHDYYDGSIQNVRSHINKYDGVNHHGAIWLNTQGVVKLTDKTALVGHDGWYDGGYSDWFKSRLVMTEYHVTQEFRFQPPLVVHKRLQELAQECADHILNHVEVATQTYKNVLFATHVPAFRNNSRAPDRRLSDSQWLPNMSSKKAGDALLHVAKNHPEVKFTCLSGHTHTSWEEQYLANLREITGASRYGNPSSSIRVIEVE